MQILKIVDKENEKARMNTNALRLSRRERGRAAVASFSSTNARQAFTSSFGRPID